MLIYLGAALQRKLMTVFHYALKPAGYLMLGHAESVGVHADLFALMNKKNKVYRKKPAAATAPHQDTFRPPFRTDPTASPAPAGHNETKLVLNDATRILMERYAPPSVLLDQQFHVVQFNGQTGLYPGAAARRAELRHPEARARRAGAWPACGASNGAQDAEDREAAGAAHPAGHGVA